MCIKCREAWKCLVAVLQFWGDEASTANSVVYGGRECPVSALAEYVLNTINLGLEPGSRVTWDNMVTQTPWMAKRLHSMMDSQERMVRCQALPVEGVSSDLEIALERRYSKHLLNEPRGRGKLIVGNPPARGHKPVPSPPRSTKTGQTEALKLHLRRGPPGEGWSTVESKHTGPDVGCLYQTPKDDQPKEGEQVAQPGGLPLTDELLAPGEELMGELDYVEENNLGSPDPEVAEAVANIPEADVDIEMWESNAPLGFEPEVTRSGYDINLVRANPTGLGLASPVTAREDKMLDEEASSRTPGAGRPGTNIDLGCADN